MDRVGEVRNLVAFFMVKCWTDSKELERDWERCQMAEQYSKRGPTKVE